MFRNEMSFSQKSTLLIFIILNKKLIGKLVGYFVCVFFLIQYLSWGIQFSRAEFKWSRNPDTTQKQRH